jgi:hypothetical protein
LQFPIVLYWLGHYPISKALAAGHYTPEWPRRRGIASFGKCNFTYFMEQEETSKGYHL